MAKVNQSDKNVELLLLGFYEPKIGGANGYYTAIQKYIDHIIPWHEFFQLPSSFVTDGVSINIGNNNGYWGLIDEDNKDSDSHILKIWCTVHYSTLAWK